uniref:Ig-like domain-containing protein n=1 Tax=Leptobrachium leishanense TaxID=445787 RepID=A0A8C5WJS5_9ANUR
MELLLLLALLPGCLCSVSVVVTPLVEVETGTNAEISCKPRFRGSPGYTAEWVVIDDNDDIKLIASLRDGTIMTDPAVAYNPRAEVKSDLTLIIKDVRISDQRTFICKVSSNSEGTGEGRARLMVYDSPEIPELSFNAGILSVTESFASEIGTCISRNAFPAPTIEWYKNNELLQSATEKNADLYVSPRTITESSGLFTVSSTLFLRPTKEDKNAAFSCKVLYQMPSGSESRMESQAFNLSLHYYTENVKFEVLSTLPIKEGDDLVLRCHGDGFPPPSYIMSMIQGESESEIHSGIDGVLTINNVSREASGKYHCQAMDFDSPPEIILNRELALFVHYLDVPSLIPKEDIKVSLGQDPLLTCSGEGSEKPELRWKKAGSVILEGSRLRVRNISYSQSGVYTCEANSPTVQGLHSEKSITVTVEGPPQLEFENDMAEVQAEGHVVMLSCSAIGHPEPEIMWSPPGLEITQQVSGMHVMSKAKVKVSPKLLNAVSCTAKNDHGTSQKNFTLKIEQSGSGSSTAIIAVVVCVVLLLLVVALFYFLQKKGKLTCGGSEKKSLTQDPASAELAPEMKSDKRSEQHGLISSPGGNRVAEVSIYSFYIFFFMHAMFFNRRVSPVYVLNLSFLSVSRQKRWRTFRAHVQRSFFPSPGTPSLCTCLLPADFCLHCYLHLL